jgi:hypothetical protein
MTCVETQVILPNEEEYHIKGKEKRKEMKKERLLLMEHAHNFAGNLGQNAGLTLLGAS